MSKKVSRQNYEKKPFNRMKQWIRGEADSYIGNVESGPKFREKLNEKEVEKHRKDQEMVRVRVRDTEQNKIYKNFLGVYKIVQVVSCFSLIMLLLVAVSYLPPVGSAENPANNEVSEKYIEDGMQDTGAVNIVTGMILDYRAFDTFGEASVLFIATWTVLIMLRNDKKKGKGSSEEDEMLDHHYEPKDDIILQKITCILFPIIVIFGIYVILNGHLSPGGGFSGGAIIGAGLILYLNAFGFEKTEKFFTEKTYKWVSFSALTFYCLAKSYSFYTGAHHLESGISLGTPGDIISAGLILPLNISVGLVVACTIYAFYALFRKGGF